MKEPVKMKKEFILADNVSYIYKSGFENVIRTKAVANVSLSIQKGQFVVVLGRNGSGKSTLARLVNALLLPSDGVVYVNGLDTSIEEKLWEVRRTAGMVFQNPDNQIVGTTVEEDTAFGPENLGVPPADIRKRVDEALAMVGMSDYATHAPHLLSGGQKQRVAIAGILAMKPECIILDEATAMLDPVGRKKVMKVLHVLNKEEGITIIHITHNMDEACDADRIIVINNGAVELDGSPKEVFKNVQKIKALGLDVPQVTELFYELGKSGIELPDDVLTVDQAFTHLSSLLKA